MPPAILRPMTGTRRSVARALCYVALAMPILACGGGATCLGWVEDDQGGRHSPELGVSERAQAQRNACSTYCVAADPQADAMYRIWLSSPRGNPNLPRWEGMYEDPSIASYLEQCIDTCVADIASGSRRGGVDCEE